MTKKGNWEALMAMPKIMHDGLAADYTVIDEIHRRLQKHPERNPLRVSAFTELVELAILAWGEDSSIGDNPYEYLENLFDLNPETRQKLVRRGYLLDVEVAIKPDTTDESAEASVEPLSHS